MKKVCISLLLIISISIISAFACGGVTASGAASTTTTKTTTTQVTTTKPTTTKPAFQKYTAYVKVNTTNVRKKPSSKATSVAKYHKGRKVTVIAKSGNWRKVGDNKWIHKDNLSTKHPMGTYNGVRLKYYGKYNVTSPKLTRSRGVINYKGHKETWYSTKEYGQSRTAYTIKGGKHLAEDGTWRDEDGYICVAANPSYYKKYSKLMTTLGPAKVYDCGCAYGIIDIYTNW